MIRRPPRSTRTDTLFPYTTLFRSAEAYRQLRGRDMAMIFQDPMMTLNPTLRVDTQMIEAIQAHNRVSRKAARERAIQVLGMVGIPSPADRRDRERVVWGRSVSVRVDLGGRRIIKKKSIDRSVITIVKYHG